ncbi:hypothetical protein BC833DRAFT_565729 [Globomyces pollinis-pini]|nr:hypothetical protein BC833DRAFT_565729 [Globomyces pollinis-pini]
MKGLASSTSLATSTNLLCVYKSLRRWTSVFPKLSSLAARQCISLTTPVILTCVESLTINNTICHLDNMNQDNQKHISGVSPETHHNDDSTCSINLSEVEHTTPLLEGTHKADLKSEKQTKEQESHSSLLPKLNPSTVYTQPIESNTTTGPTCRICYQEGNRFCKENPLISPCPCDGSMKYVHLACLNTWRQTRTTDIYQCEVCHFPYNINIRTQRAKFLRSTELTIGLMIIITSLLVGICGYTANSFKSFFEILKISSAPYVVKHVISGFLVVGILGFFTAILHSLLVSNSSSWYFISCDGCNMSGCDCNDDSILIPVVLIFIAAIGLLYYFVVGYVILYECIKDTQARGSLYSLNERVNKTGQLDQADHKLIARQDGPSAPSGDSTGLPVPPPSEKPGDGPSKEPTKTNNGPNGQSTKTKGSKTKTGGNKTKTKTNYPTITNKSDGAKTDEGGVTRTAGQSSTETIPAGPSGDGGVKANSEMRLMSNVVTYLVSFIVVSQV